MKRFAALSVLLFCAHTQLYAQVPAAQAQELTQKPVQETVQEQTPLDITVASDGNASATDDILRLEETIRGNKEQPKVLSIVPWQLPLYQRIDRNEQRWAPVKTKLKPMERNSFLKEIKLLKGIQNNQASMKAETSIN
ncbi:hypothetical protein GNIT_3648 [Glaciecola nitratireducens FR1064]|uniref:Uncharacterized protein n=1 Tax=Glaciecola nitratireducens (strain JCM 12485 / KCTC 12276 / FR1064) TaxID=1085623 RepID=G4QP34_GLANF|nr:hypothetical protein GNIT_3648 [Glaciecola nitratireducens FR1064]